MARSGYEFYLDKCLLPVTPSKLQLKIDNANKTLTLMDEGEINILKKAGLTEVEFTCGIPQVKYPFAVYKDGFKTADYYLNFLEDLKNSMKPFQFIVCRSLPGNGKLFGTNLKVTLEEYKLTEDAKNGFDVEVTVKLKQWRDYGTKTVNVILTQAGPMATVEPQRGDDTSPAPSQAATYTVVKGDCLWNIAKKFYGSGSKYTVIYDANRVIIGGNPNRIYPGQVLSIPAA